MGNKKDKEYYYKLKIKRDFIKSIILIILTMLFLFIISKLISKNNYIKENGILTGAVITDIKYRSEINKEDIQSVYVSYVVDGKLYNSKLNEKSSSMYIGKKLNIYYNTKNPQEIALESSSKSLFIFKYFIYVMLVIGIFCIIISFKRIIRYYTTLKGKEVEAEIVGIKEKNLFGSKQFIIQCKWVDEKGIEHIFNSLPFNEPYFMNEFNKMEIKKLKVRFKENDIAKYVVLTEKLDKRLHI